ncbi:hypothetical protein RI367_002120 [Sorochytrium milnesiophthora]
MASERHDRATAAKGVLEDLVEYVLLDIIFQEHRKAKLTAAACQACGQRCREYVSGPAVDVFGTDPSLAAGTEKTVCAHCNAPFGVGKFAKHLERCMGLEGARNIARQARKTGGATPTPASDDNSPDKKKKKATGKLPGAPKAKRSKTLPSENFPNASVLSSATSPAVRPQSTDGGHGGGAQDMDIIDDARCESGKDTTTAPFLVKSQRHLCWAARDQYLDCINKAYGVDAPSADPQSKCTRLLAEFEKACPKSWVLRQMGIDPRN